MATPEEELLPSMPPVVLVLVLVLEDEPDSEPDSEVTSLVLSDVPGLESEGSVVADGPDEPPWLPALVVDAEGDVPAPPVVEAAAVSPPSSPPSVSAVANVEHAVVSSNTAHHRPMPTVYLSA